MSFNLYEEVQQEYTKFKGGKSVVNFVEHLISIKDSITTELNKVDNIKKILTYLYLIYMVVVNQIYLIV